MELDKQTFEVELTLNTSGEVILKFNLGDKTSFLNFQSDNSTDIQTLFGDLLKKAINGPICLELKETQLDPHDYGLFIETAVDYINHLNKELEQLETNQDLDRLRKYFNK